MKYAAFALTNDVQGTAIPQDPCRKPPAFHSADAFNTSYINETPRFFPGTAVKGCSSSFLADAKANVIWSFSSVNKLDPCQPYVSETTKCPHFDNVAIVTHDSYVPGDHEVRSHFRSQEIQHSQEPPAPCNTPIDHETPLYLYQTPYPISIPIGRTSHNPTSLYRRSLVNRNIALYLSQIPHSISIPTRRASNYPSSLSRHTLVNRNIPIDTCSILDPSQSPHPSSFHPFLAPVKPLNIDLKHVRSICEDW
jgi:hypothetical protein